MAARHDYNPKALIAARKREASKPGRDKPAGRGSGLTPRIKRGIGLLVYGDDDGRSFKDLREVAAAVGLSHRTISEAMNKPAVAAYYQQQLAAKKTGLKALGLNVIEDVMTNPELRKTPAGNKVRTDAAKVALTDPPGSPSVNVQINNNLQVTPGYVIDLSPEDFEERRSVERGELITITADPVETAVGFGLGDS